MIITYTYILLLYVIVTTEKSIVLNMLRLAASGVISYSGSNATNKHYTDEYQKGVWQQNQSHTDDYHWKQQPHPPVMQDRSRENEDDPIVQVARQLSQLASRQGHSAMDDIYYQSSWQQRKRPRSASMDQHPKAGGHTSSRRRSRSQSANTVTKAISPSPPVGVTVTKQQLQEPQHNRPPTRLRYVSTWK